MEPKPEEEGNCLFRKSVKWLTKKKIVFWSRSESDTNSNIAFTIYWAIETLEAQAGEASKLKELAGDGTPLLFRTTNADTNYIRFNSKTESLT